MPPILLKIIVSSQDATKACDVLSKYSKLSNSAIKRAMLFGAVWYRRQGKKGEQRIRKATFGVQPGDQLTLFYDESILSRKAPTADCEKDFQHYSIWFKPAGLLTQGTRYGDHCALTRQAEKYFIPHRKVYVIHRIDRETAGLVIVGHSRHAASRISSMFQQRKIIKHYLAWVQGNISHHGRQGEINLSRDGREALTRYRHIEYNADKDQSLVDVELMTGRTHQIRRHFDLTGYPIVGDPRYGKGNKNHTGLRLIANSLEFSCPFGKGIVKVSIRPKHNKLFHNLKNHTSPLF